MDNQLGDSGSEDSSDLEASLQESAASIERALSNASSLIHAASIVHHLSDEVRESFQGKSLETLRKSLIPGCSLQPLASLVCSVEQGQPPMESEREVDAVGGSQTVEENDDRALDQTSTQLEEIEDMPEESSTINVSPVKEELIDEGSQVDEAENRPPLSKSKQGVERKQKTKKAKGRKHRSCKVAPMESANKSGNREVQTGKQAGGGKGKKTSRGGSVNVYPSTFNLLEAQRKNRLGQRAVFDYRYQDRWTPRVQSPARKEYERILLNSLYICASHPKVHLNPEKARGMIKRKERSAMGLSPCIVLNKCHDTCEEGQIQGAVKCLESQVDKEYNVVHTVAKIMKSTRTPGRQDPETQSVGTDDLFDSDEDNLIEDMLTETGFNKLSMRNEVFSIP